jgi:hypothetical protein
MKGLKLHRFLTLLGVSLGAPLLLGACGLGLSALGGSRATCKPGTGAPSNPSTIDEAVTLINSLPKPVTVPCFLESLDRPLKLAATNSNISAQPASGDRSPRMFLFNDKLIISVVPSGVGRSLVEFSYLTAVDVSIKAEVEFPVNETLTREAPFERVQASPTMSRCATCHGFDTRADEIDYALAFKSRALRPSMFSEVSVDDIQNEAKNCDEDQEPERCAILKAIFSKGEVLPQAFPEGMPTMMGN